MGRRAASSPVTPSLALGLLDRGERDGGFYRREESLSHLLLREEKARQGENGEMENKTEKFFPESSPSCEIQTNCLFYTFVLVIEAPTLKRSLWSIFSPTVFGVLGVKPARQHNRKMTFDLTVLYLYINP